MYIYMYIYVYICICIYIYVYIYIYSIQHGDFKISNQSCETMGRLAAGLVLPKLRFPVWDRYPTTDCNISAMDGHPSTRQPKTSFQASGIYFSLCLGRSFGLTM